MWPTKRLGPIYNPLYLSEQEVLNNFIARQQEFSTIFSEIKNSSMQYPEQHIIIQGRRGQGKTMLLVKLFQEIKKDKSLNHRIIPVICNRSSVKIHREKKLKKLLHWKKVLISACEQSGRNHIPEITEITPLSNISDKLNNSALKIILNPESTTSLKQLSLKRDNAASDIIEIIVGPEGGLTEEEIYYLEDRQFKNIRFGPRILRTETAGPAVISACQMLWGDC